MPTTTAKQRQQQEANLVRWIEALVSGDYKQQVLKPDVSYGQLYSPKTKCYCALGVAAEVMKTPRLGQWFWFGYIPGELPMTKTFTPGNWFGKHFGTAIIPEKISHMSDNGTSFADIAVYLLAFLQHYRGSNFEWRVLSIATRERVANDNLAEQSL